MLSQRKVTNNNNRKDEREATRRYEEDKKSLQGYWDFYATRQSKGNGGSRTGDFFSSIPLALKQDFISSTRRMLQFGISSAYFHSIMHLTNTRECIGYDYNQTAITLAEKQGIKCRRIDLNDLDKEQLHYQDTLAADLLVTSDIISIDILEYLTPKATVALLFFLLNNAKSNSTFYFQTYISNQKDINSQAIDIPHGYVASFFAPRTDVKFRLHRTEDAGDGKQITGTRNQLIVSKL